MPRILFATLLFLPFMSSAQVKGRATTVIFMDGSTRSFLLADPDDVKDPHRFVLTDGLTGERVEIKPQEAKTVFQFGGDLWISAIVDLDGSPHILTTEELSAYRPPSDTVFLLNEFNGSVVSLYSMKDRLRKHIFISKKNRSFQELIQKTIKHEGLGGQWEQDYDYYQTQLAEVVKDCPVMANGTGSVAFGVVPIANFLQAYEMDCLKNNKTQMRSVPQKNPLSLAVMVGYTFNRPSFVSDNPNDLIPPGPVQISGTPSFGLSLMVHAPNELRKFSVGAEMYFNRFRAHADTVWKKGGTQETHTSKGLDYSLSSIRLALLGQYHLVASGKLRPFIKGGLSMGYALSSYASSVTYVYQSGNLEEIQTRDPFRAQGFNPFQLGFTLGAGMDISRFSIQYKFESSAGYVTTISTGSSLQVHSLFVSYVFN